MKKGTAFLLLATGAAAVSAAIIGVSHCMLPKPVWAYDQPMGWTIYPPLSALPGASPPDERPDMVTYFLYAGLLGGATIAAVLALISWLSGLLLAKRQVQLQRWLKISPGILLIPCAVHLVGGFHLVQMTKKQDEAFLKQLESQTQYNSYLADSLVEHAKSQQEIDSTYEALD